jgi:hypothetical protein
MNKRVLTEDERLALRAAFVVLRKYNISVLCPDASHGGVLVERGYGTHMVQGYGDDITGAVEDALSKG